MAPGVPYFGTSERNEVWLNIKDTPGYVPLRTARMWKGLGKSGSAGVHMDDRRPHMRAPLLPDRLSSIVMASITWALILYSCVGMLLVLHGMTTLDFVLFGALYIVLTVLCLWAHAKTMLTDPGAVVRGAHAHTRMLGHESCILL